MRINKLVIIAGAAVALILVLYFLVYTTAGSKFLADRMISEYADHRNLDFEELEGNLGSGMTFKNIEIKDVKNLPAGSTWKIQRLFFNLTSFGINGADVEIENVRLKLPDSGPVIISGTFKEQQLDINIYSKGFTVTEVLSYLPDFKMLVPIKGDVNDIDLFITGNYLEPVVKGAFTIKKFMYKGFVLASAPLNFNINLEDIKDDVKLYGNVHMERGELKTKKVLVMLDKGDLNFSGPWNQPQINLKGSAKVEKTKISIDLKGTIEKPELTLASEPPHPRQKLMVMLATGKSWQSVEDLGDSGLNSGALTKDFIDYFFFAGKSNQFAKKFGVSEFSVTFDQDHQGVSAKKELTEKLEVGYGIEQTKANGQIADVSQKLEGEYKLNDQVSVGVERELKKKQANEFLDDQLNENNDKVMIEYKKSF